MSTGTLTDLFSRSVYRYGERPAVSDDDQVLSYRELDHRSDRMAAALREGGVGREDRVAIDLPRSAAVFVSILGVLKAGGAYLAIDPHTSEARRERMLRTGRVVAAITGDGDDQALAEAGVAAVPYERAVASTVHPLQAGPVKEDDAASLLFTSGSSGEPKGIVLEHRNVSFFATNPSLPALQAEDRIGQISSIAFDAFHWEMWAGLASGGRVTILPDVPELLADDFYRTMRRYRISAMLVPTMVVNQVVREDRDAFASLRILQAGGDVLLPSTCRTIFAGAFEGELYNLYGPAETTTACTVHRVQPADLDEDSVPIGRPLRGVRTSVRGTDGGHVAAGEVGELYIGGPGVARGYLDRADLTAERFLPDPTGVGQVYRSGDLVRQRRDAVIEFVGRYDDQVKVRGFRVEPGEVERVLRRHPDVADAVVLVDGAGEDRRLLAFIVPESSISLAALREHAEQQLAHFMVPSRFVTIDEVAMTDHGKRDLQSLVARLWRERRREEEHVPSATHVERYLSGLWEELLGVEGVGATEDFFVLGGHSLLAFRVQARVQSNLGVVLEQGTVFRHPVLRQLATAIEEARS